MGCHRSCLPACLPAFANYCSVVCCAEREVAQGFSPRQSIEAAHSGGGGGVEVVVDSMPG